MLYPGPASRACHLCQHTGPLLTSLLYCCHPEILNHLALGLCLEPSAGRQPGRLGAQSLQGEPGIRRFQGWSESPSVGGSVSCLQPAGLSLSKHFPNKKPHSAYPRCSICSAPSPCLTPEPWGFPHLLSEGVPREVKHSAQGCPEEEQADQGSGPRALSPLPSLKSHAVSTRRRPVSWDSGVVWPRLLRAHSRKGPVSSVCTLAWRSTSLQRSCSRTTLSFGGTSRLKPPKRGDSSCTPSMVGTELDVLSKPPGPAAPPYC